MQNRTTVILAAAVTRVRRLASKKDELAEVKVRFLMRTLTATVALCALVFCGTVSAQQPREKPKELQILGQYVGDWTSDVTSKPAVWTPKEKRLRTSNHAKFVLDGWFLQHIEVNHVVGDPEKVTKVLFIWTFDPKLKKYVGWSFHSSGIIGKATGTWDVASKTFKNVNVEVPPNTMSRFTETFPNKNTINGTLVFTSNDGRKLFDMVWTRKRQAGVAGQPTRKQWDEIGKPIEPIPAKVKKLNGYIGEWDSQVIQRPSVVSPNGRTSKGKITAQWILDGRFLFGTLEVGNHKSNWVTGYDTNKNAYRHIRFTHTGLIFESTGQWNEKTRSFVWKWVNAPSGITRTHTTRFVGQDAYHSHVLDKNKDSKIHMDLTLKTTRRK